MNIKKTCARRQAPSHRIGELRNESRHRVVLHQELAQLLPLEESLKYELLGIGELDDFMAALHGLLNRFSGEGPS